MEAINCGADSSGDIQGSILAGICTGTRGILWPIRLCLRVRLLSGSGILPCCSESC